VKGYNLVLEYPQKVQSKYVVSGFYGFGAVGFLTVNYLIKKLNFERIGYIDTPFVPDVTSIEDYGLSVPHEIFYYRDGSIAAVLNRINPSHKHFESYSRAFVNLVRTLEAEAVILIGGLDRRYSDGQSEYRWFKIGNLDIELGAPKMHKGLYLVGPLASLLIVLYKHRIPALVVLPYTDPESVDHRAAAVAIRIISEMTGLNIDVSELLQYAKEFEALREEIEKVLSDKGFHERTPMHM